MPGAPSSRCIACRPSASPVSRTLSAGGAAATGCERSSPARDCAAPMAAGSVGRMGGGVPSILVVMEMLLKARSNPVTACPDGTLADAVYRASTHDLDDSRADHPATDDA